MYRRRQRARPGGGRKATGEGSDVLMESEEKPDYVESLVRKYMRKCRVESSTDSESDNNETLGSHLLPSHGAECRPKKVKLLKLQFLDPYDGDSEETSAHSDSSSQDCFLSEVDSIIIKDDPITMECGPAQEQPPPRAEDGGLASLEMAHSCSLTARSGQRTGGTTYPSDMSPDSEVVSPDLGRFVMIGVNPRALHSSSSIFPASLTSEENSDFSLFQTTMKKRKIGDKLENEKLRRKKARVVEHLV